jgi:hypothetical protein
MTVSCAVDRQVEFLPHTAMMRAADPAQNRKR